MEYTNEQRRWHLQWYVRYETVRDSGRWNMFDRQAQWASGLTSEEYTFVMRNYAQLREAYENQNK